MTCLPLPFACNSVINTLKAFRLYNRLCRGSRVTFAIPIESIPPLYILSCGAKGRLWLLPN